LNRFSPSYWDHNTYFKDVDTCIIGAGITGLTSALFLKKKHPASKILVVERSAIPYGASTRNAGFACFGSISEILDDMENESEDIVYRRIEDRYKGILKLRELAGDKILNYESHGGYEIFTEKDTLSFERCRDLMPALNRDLNKVFGTDVFSINDGQIHDFRFSGVSHMIRHSEEGQLDTGAMMRTLLELTRSAGVEVLHGVHVDSVHDNDDHCEIRAGDDLLFTARSVIVAVNGFAGKFLRDTDIRPARSQVLVTAPVNNLSFRGTFHYDKGYTYFRNVGNRVLIGGGRNIDLLNEETEEMAITSKIQDHLTTFLREIILPGTDPVVEHRWSGIMGVGNSKSPVVERTGRNIYCAVRLGGMGVAIGTHTGEKVAALVSEGHF
jgi:glycine/D-amino acid oxidase-like deaminating enzyme